MNSRPKHTPIRTCVVCREKSGKRTLTRVVYSETGLVIDLTGKAHGRGAYLCDNPDCWQRAATTDVLAHALRVRLTADDRERIRQRVV
ncbi:YlxR family protein [Aggregatilineales bacterium SYSU G02658]